MTERQEIEQTMTALEAQRMTLGEPVVEISLAALRQRLMELDEREALNSALKGERKHVTVMFADISGFTAMSEKLDPEEVRSIINACFERLSAVIDHYEGHIDKFIGDEIMALFGAPTAHENDPERALRAALEMMVALEEFNVEYAAHLSQPLALHFGINSGLVIAGGIGANQRQAYSVMGDTANLASRLEGLSEAGEILVGEETYRRAAPLFEFEALKPVKVKGKAYPVRVYRLLRAKAGHGGQVRGIEGFSSPLVGRVDELAKLSKALDNLYQGQGSVILVSGEAGLGKSRLIEELRLMSAQRPQGGQINWVEGHTLAYGESVSYLMARDMLRHILGVDLEASLADVEMALRAELDRLLPDEAAENYPYLAYLLDIPLDQESAQRIRYLKGDALHQQILQSAQNFILTKTRQTPLVLGWEDLHWADPSSLGLLEALLPLTQHCQLLLFLVYRPGHEGRLWDFQQRFLAENQIVIQLAPLTSPESSQLLDNLLGCCQLSEKARSLIINKTEGNPFYLEEVIRSLIENGALTRSDDTQGWVTAPGLEDIKIPDTLQGVVMARVDRLATKAKRILQVASVIGRDFSYRVLARVIDQGTDDLKILEALGLIALKRSTPYLEYTFQHIFTQESVYNSLLRRDCRQLHQQIGEVLESFLADEPSESDTALVLAHHFEQSGDKGRALKYLKHAAANASATYANQEAKALYDRALALLDQTDYAARWDILADQERILNRLGERGRQATGLTLMQTLAEVMADNVRLATTHNRRSTYFDRISEYQAAAEAAEAGLRAAHRCGNEHLQAESLNLLALAAWRRFDYPEVQKWATQALKALMVVGDPAIRITSLFHLGRASYRLGQYDLALQYIQAAQNLTQDIDNRDSEATSHLILGWIYQRLGHYDLAEQHFQTTLETRRTIGHRYGEATALSHLGWLAYDQHNPEAGLDYCQQALDISRAIGDRENEAYALSGLGFNHEQLGRLDAAASNYQAALTIHREIGAATLTIFDQTGLARIALTQNKVETAREYITPVTEWILAGNAQKFWDPWVIYQSTYQVLDALGESDTARNILDEAHTVLQQRATEISNQELRRCFSERVKVNREIEQAWQATRSQGPFAQGAGLKSPFSESQVLQAKI
jgi:class 3 adenylate cyclase/predicted ATPase